MLLKGLAAALAVVATSLAVASAATPARIAPGQRVELKVLLLSADGQESGFGAWKAQLEREGVPYDTFVAYDQRRRIATLTDARLADYGAQLARYQAVILATGDLGHDVRNADGTVSHLSALTDTEWAALARFERTFGVRRLSDYTAPSAARGLTAVPGAWQDGNPARLTAAGRAAFPYLRGPVTIADDAPGPNEAFGYGAKPVAGAPWLTLLEGAGETALLGIYTHPEDGREELVMTVASNQFQNHNQLLRHGMLNWVTRGVFLGAERHYLGLQIDDLFLGDDVWDPVTHTTRYDQSSRMTPADVDRAIGWSRGRGLRLDMVFNGGGSEPGDPLAAYFRDNAGVRAAFGYINHTDTHANLDCSTSSFIRDQIRDNVAFARANGLPLDPTELVTGEHSGLANARPGNPGTIDPPSIDETTVGTGTLAAGTYDYALTARSPAGETVPYEEELTVPAASSVTVHFDAVCHAIGFDLYRRVTGTTDWTRVASMPRSATAATDDGVVPVTHTLTDTGAAGTAAAPPAVNGAALAPYGQNPAFLAGVTAGGVSTIASDASKGYPTTPTVITSPLLPAGASFVMGAVRAVPRYPSNVYYNASRQGQQLDEYNWIYVAPPGGACVPVAGVTTCRAAAATWAEYVSSETQVMFRHVTGNDARPHYFHQSNLADHNPALPDVHPDQGGVLYPVIDALVARYEAAFDRAAAPLVQLGATQIAATLARQEAWARDEGAIRAWLQDGRVYVRNTGSSAVTVPLTGVEGGESYGGQRSRWVSVDPGAQVSFAPAEPAPTRAPAVRGEPRVGERLEAEAGAWTGAPELSYQWQRCVTACVNVAGATEAAYTLEDADEGRTVRVAVLAGNWVSSVSQALSAPTRTIAPRAPAAREERAGRDNEPPARPAPPSGSTPAPGSAPPSGSTPPSGTSRPVAAPARLRLTRLSMSPRRFAVAHRRARLGSRLDGTRITWRLNRAATVRLTFQRRTRTGWVRVGRIERAGSPGTSVVRFRGRFGERRLRAQRHRLVVTAVAGRERTAPRRLAFRVVSG
ncbi:hypothetical protein DVA67_026310 [Solirubrobacter sp. CPCC 204708]|uniref:Agd3 CBM87 domain-containing protein n=1 Tax=Solirubrobacter deserti TaxID=2282478 RepID=A0ABT4RF95_9ACTN|nr:hypothetical protein [Solirubrobacter deserti]MBE2319508.1 hypothetical protein [Solirubrobacter deserti]MDA0137205.1 hypothetical protein [Solirubrobacter deserti]